MNVVTGGPRVRAERKARGWSQSDLARRTGLRQATVSRIECGGTPSRHTQERLAAAFSLPIAALYPYVDEVPGYADPLAATG